ADYQEEFLARLPGATEDVASAGGPQPGPGGDQREQLGSELGEVRQPSQGCEQLGLAGAGHVLRPSAQAEILHLLLEHNAGEAERPRRARDVSALLAEDLGDVARLESRSRAAQRAPRAARAAFRHRLTRPSGRVSRLLR